MTGDSPGVRSPFLSRILVRDVRCLARAEAELDPGTNLLLGANAQGKSSFLESVAILLRLQSPRTRRLGDVLRRGARGLVVDGWFGDSHLQFYYSPERRKLALDSIEQRSPSRYLELARVVWFGNDDIALIRGAPEVRRQFLDQVGLQTGPGYREALRGYVHALRSRNRILRGPRPSRRELDAFAQPLLAHGQALIGFRRALLGRLGEAATAAHARIAPASRLEFAYRPGCEGELAAALEASREPEWAARQTLVGPHRDDLEPLVDGHPAARFASEGQQRSVVLAVRLAQAELLRTAHGSEPTLLLDDVFGELDPARREALFRALPAAAQKIVTATAENWLPSGIPRLRFRVEAGTIARAKR